MNAKSEATHHDEGASAVLQQPESQEGGESGDSRRPAKDKNPWDLPPEAHGIPGYPFVKHEPVTLKPKKRR